MFKLLKNSSLLQKIYVIVYIILFIIVVYTPLLVTGPFAINNDIIIEEEILEITILIFLFTISFLIHNLYNKEVQNHKQRIDALAADKKTTEEKLTDAFKYIGRVNIQIQEIESVLNNVEKYPSSKNEMKKIFSFLGEKILGIVNADWVMFRIVNIESQKTLSEHLENRPKKEIPYPHISNKDVIQKLTIKNLTVISSNPQNMNIISTCIIPTDKLSPEQEILIKATVNQMTMLFVIFNSIYYKK